MAAAPMVHLTTVGGAFHGRLVAARLGAEGILTELRGALEGPYPAIGVVEVYVDAPHLEAARQILLADAVDAAFAESEDELLDPLGADPQAGGALHGSYAPYEAYDEDRSWPRPHRALFAMLALLVVVALLVSSRVF